MQFRLSNVRSNIISFTLFLCSSAMKAGGKAGRTSAANSSSRAPPQEEHQPPGEGSALPLGLGPEEAPPGEGSALPLGPEGAKGQSKGYDALAPPQGRTVLWAKPPPVAVVSQVYTDVVARARPKAPPPFCWVRLQLLSGRSVPGRFPVWHVKGLCGALDRGEVAGVPGNKDMEFPGGYQLIWGTTLLDEDLHLKNDMGCPDDVVLTIVYRRYPRLPTYVGI